MKWVVTVVKATERQVMAQIRLQKIGERKACLAEISKSILLLVDFSLAALGAFSDCSGTPPRCMPMLSGERLMPRHQGTPATRNGAPARKAAGRQPKFLTAIARSGVINAPPTGTAALTTVMARARN